MNLSARRVYANLIDGLISVVLFFLGIWSSSATSTFSNLIFQIFFALGFGYFFFKDIADGAGIGKRLLGIRAQHTDGRPVGLAGSFYRNFVFAVPFIGTLDVIIGYFSKNSQRPADRYIDAQVLIAPSPPWKEGVLKKLTAVMIFSAVVVGALHLVKS